jgi:uncharacterized protein YneR
VNDGMVYYDPTVGENIDDRKCLTPKHELDVYIDIKYTNNTRVYLELSGKLSLYQGEKLVAQFDVEEGISYEHNDRDTVRYHIPAESLYGVDCSNLTVKYTYESIEVDIHTYYYDPKEVTLS